METKFTPGPMLREIDDFDGSALLYPKYRNGKEAEIGRWAEVVVVKNYDEDDPTEFRANVELYAAAPEMYEMLEQLIPGPGQNMNDVNKHTLRDLWEELRARINA